MAAHLSALQPHSDTPQPLVRSLSAGAARSPVGLRFEYRLSGKLGELALPAVGSGRRRDGLWRHSCFEAFVVRASAAAPEYLEFNFAPQGDWAAYRFGHYREGMTPLALERAPRLEARRTAEELVLTATVALAGVSILPDGAALRVALAAVIEDGGGRLSYWALKHPPGKPDFHHADGFLLQLDGVP
jgi:hypothetical protein